jgi:ribose-phosphate pyrophosphokinase
MISLIANDDSFELAEEMGKNLGVSVFRLESSKFADGEWDVNVGGNHFGRTVVAVHCMKQPINDSLVELLLIVDALKRAGTAKVILVVPYLGYSRKDKKFRAGDPISCRLVANLIETAGADQLIMMDPHSASEEGFFNIPTFSIDSAELFAREIQARGLDNLAIASPDLGAVKRAKRLAKLTDARLVILNKERDLQKHDQLSIGEIIGDVKGKNIVLFDDIISTGSTLVKAAALLKENGANTIIACATHQIFSDETASLLASSQLDEVMITDTCPLPTRYIFGKLKVLPIAAELADAVRKVISTD